jgi:glycosyltransferase involved in cell wall biosynthesis
MSIPKITFCIPSKSNLRYLKTCIPSIRENAHRKDHHIIVFVDQDEDGTVEWLKKVADDYNLIYYVNPHLGKKLYGIGMAYDYCIEKSLTDVFMIFHADMMLGIDADLHAYTRLSPKSVVCSTRVEPPLHPNAGEKILMDFGIWPEDYKKEEFNKFVETQLHESKVSEGIFAPWMMYKSEYLEILGGHDPKLKSAREDSDVFNRMLLAGFSFIQPWNSLVYHLTGRGGQFQHGEVTKEHSQKSLEWQQLMQDSTLEYIRKWGTQVLHTSLMKPIVLPKYNIALVVVGCNLLTLKQLEPWCDRIYIEDEMRVLYSYYWDQMHNRTEYDLSKRVLTLENNSPESENDIILYLDGRNMSSKTFEVATNIPYILQSVPELGTYTVEGLKLVVNNLDTYEKDYIKVNKDIYNEID